MPIFPSKISYFSHHLWLILSTSKPQVSFDNTTSKNPHILSFSTLLQKAETPTLSYGHSRILRSLRARLLLSFEGLELHQNQVGTKGGMLTERIGGKSFQLSLSFIF